MYFGSKIIFFKLLSYFELLNYNFCPFVALNIQTGIHIEFDIKIQRTWLFGSTAPEMVWKGELFGVVLVDQTKAIDGACCRGRLSNAWLWHYSWHHHSVCWTLCIQVHTALVEKEIKRLLLEESQSDVLLAGLSILMKFKPKKKL